VDLMEHVRSVGVDKVSRMDRGVYQQLLLNPAMAGLKPSNVSGRSVIAVCGTPPALIRKQVWDMLCAGLST
jgi:hypothetical protein